MLELAHDTLDSTSSEARRLAAQHRGQLLLVHARTQTAGRGRSGRSWVSPIGGAWFSLVWPTIRLFEAYQSLPLVVGLAVRDGILAHVPSGELRIKWPNDLLLDDRKVAGILCEHAPEVSAIIIGVGINANGVHHDVGETAMPAASLGQVDVQALVRRCADRIQVRLREFECDGFTATTMDAINASLAWRDRLVTLGGCVGRCAGVNVRGQLCLDVQGQVRTFTAGELSLRESNRKPQS